MTRRSRLIGPLVVAAAAVAGAAAVAAAVSLGPASRVGPSTSADPASSVAAAASMSAATNAGPPATTVSSPTPQPAPSSATVSSEALPVGDLPGWEQVFVDDFATPVPAGAFPAAVATAWSAYPPSWRDTSGRGQYATDIISVHDGLLDIHLQTRDGVPRVAAPGPRLGTTQLRGSQAYGRYAVRFRADPVPGFKTAWLLWPSSEQWPRDGEIDFPEGDLTGTIGAYLHHQGATTGRDQAHFSTQSRYGTWHTAVIEWRPGSCEFFLDGTSIGRTTTRVPDTAMRWVLQTETSLSGQGPPANAEGHVLIDWVAIWRYTG